MRIVWAFLALALLSMPTHAQQVAKEAWLESMEIIIPTFFCKEDQYFRQCFEVSVQECEEVAASSARVCIGRLGSEVPAVLQLPQDGNLWGTRLGSCAGTAYEGVLAEKRISTPKCNDPGQWAGG